MFTLTLVLLAYPPWKRFTEPVDHSTRQSLTPENFVQPFLSHPLYKRNRADPDCKMGRPRYSLTAYSGYLRSLRHPHLERPFSLYRGHRSVKPPKNIFCEPTLFCDGYVASEYSKQAAKINKLPSKLRTGFLKLQLQVETFTVWSLPSNQCANFFF